jgi:3-methyl-2-oxobutanoate hydroxymethyltransferase
MSRKKIAISDLMDKKRKGEKITMLTAYDYPTALALDQAEIDAILIGDSVAMVVLGLENTLPMTMDEMVHHVKAVTRGAKYAHIVADMPFMSYNISKEEAIRNAGRFLKEAGADAIKLEGGVTVAEEVRAIVRAGIPVMGHIGLTPQSISLLGGFKIQGKDAKGAKRLVDDAKRLEEAGAYSIVIEAVPAPIAKMITESVSIPTIGIGAGQDCDGQVLVTHDLLGLFDRFTPKFVKKYANLREEMIKAFRNYRDEVLQNKFPTEEHSFTIKAEALSKLEEG